MIPDSRIGNILKGILYFFTHYVQYKIDLHLDGISMGIKHPTSVEYQYHFEPLFPYSALQILAIIYLESISVHLQHIFS